MAQHENHPIPAAPLEAQLERDERLALVLRAISGDPEIEVSIGESTSAMLIAGAAVLPKADEDDPAALVYQEACCDMLAVRHAHHDGATHASQRPTPGAKPLTAISDAIAQRGSSGELPGGPPMVDPVQLHDAMEDLRLSLLGGRKLAGLAARSPHWWSRKLPPNAGELRADDAINADDADDPADATDPDDADELGIAPGNAAAVAIALWRCMHAAAAADEPRWNALPKPPRLSRPPDLPGSREDLAKLLQSLAQQIGDQSGFAATVSDIFDALTRAPQQESERSPEQDEETSQPENEDEPETFEDEDDQSEAMDQPSGEDFEKTEEDGDAERDITLPISAQSDPSDGDYSADPYEPVPYTPPEVNQNSNAAYSAYTTDYDLIASARTLVESDDELARLRGTLDRQWGEMQEAVAPLAARLQRVLLALSPQNWEYNLDEGYINPAHLSRVPIKPTRPGIFRQPKEIKERDVSVTLLLDNSGSMRGYPIRIASLCAELLARTLERCKIRTEVLGYTTKEWKGGDSYKRWKNDKRPHNPGRLNDILHIVYKADSVSWQHARPHLALMLRENLLKENIDGEALQWAVSRLKRHSEKRRILIVISDGAPVDDMTLSYNAPDYLDRHLKEVIGDIEKGNQCELLAIGIGYDVGRFYQNAVRIPDADSLAPVLLNELISRLKNPGSGRAN